MEKTRQYYHSLAGRKIYLLSDHNDYHEKHIAVDGVISYTREYGDVLVVPVNLLLQSISDAVYVQ